MQICFNINPDGKYPYFVFLKADLNEFAFEDRQSLVKKQLPSFSISCVIIFKGGQTRKLSKGPDLVEYGKCKHTNCRKFRIEYTSY